MRQLIRLPLFACLLLAFSLSALAQGASGYHVINKYKLGGDGGWDYITYDVKGNRVFISRSTHVMVVDASTGNVVGDIFIRRCEKKDGKLVNTTIKTYKDVGQFWTYDEQWFLEQPVYSRDYPPLKS